MAAQAPYESGTLTEAATAEARRLTERLDVGLYGWAEHS